MTSEAGAGRRRPEAPAGSETRPAPDWAGDVGLGVRAWVGDRPPTPPVPADPVPADPVAAGPAADDEAVARKILLDALTGQARSRKELAERLAKRGVPTELGERLLDRFTEVGLVDDEAFARQWVESRQRSRGLAPRALAQELRRKGVADETVREAVGAIDGDQQQQAARALVRKKLRSMRGLDPQVATRRLAGMLARKGYPPGLAFAVVRDELGAEPEVEGLD